MNDQLQNKLAEILGQIASGVKAAGDFTLAQLPDIAQQYVIYGRATGTLAVISFLVLTFFVRKGLRWAWNKSQDDDDRMVVIFLGLVVGAFSLGGLAISVGNALLVWLAPKVWLIKQLAELLK